MQFFSKQYATCIQNISSWKRLHNPFCSKTVTIFFFSQTNNWKDTCHAFINTYNFLHYIKAFDRLWRHRLWNILIHWGFPLHFIHPTQSLYAGTTTRIDLYKERLYITKSGCKSSVEQSFSLSSRLIHILTKCICHTATHKSQISDKIPINTLLYTDREQSWYNSYHIGQVNSAYLLAALVWFPTFKM